MRTIKFRAWHKKKKKWIKEFWVNPLGYPIINVKSEVLGKELPEIREDLVELLQFTGLKDKQGKEIYEGDILEGNGIFGKVYYWEGNYKVDNPAPYSHYRLHEESNGLWQIKNVEVIGNIYENSELLPK